MNICPEFNLSETSGLSDWMVSLSQIEYINKHLTMRIEAVCEVFCGSVGTCHAQSFPIIKHLKKHLGHMSLKPNLQLWQSCEA